MHNPMAERQLCFQITTLYTLSQDVGMLGNLISSYARKHLTDRNVKEALHVGNKGTRCEVIEKGGKNLGRISTVSLE